MSQGRGLRNQGTAKSGLGPRAAGGSPGGAGAVSSSAPRLGKGPPLSSTQAVATGASSRLRTGVPAFSSQIPQVAPRSWPCGPLHTPCHHVATDLIGAGRRVLRGPAAGSPRGCSTYTGLTAVTICHPPWGEAGGGLTQAQGEGTMQGMGAEGQGGHLNTKSACAQDHLPGPQS